MFGWLNRLFGGSREPPFLAATFVPEDYPPTGPGPVRYQPPITSWRRAGAGLLGERHSLLLYDTLRAEGAVEYTYLLVAWDRAARHPVLFVAAEVNQMAGVLGGGSHALGVFDPSGHATLGFSDDWGDAAKFFPKAIEVVAARLGVDPSSVQMVLPAGPAG